MKSIEITDLIRQKACEFVKNYGGEEASEDYYRAALALFSSVEVLKDYWENIDISKSLINIKPFFDAFECIDLGIDGIRINICLVRNNKIFIPKIMREADILSDVYVAAQLNSDMSTFKFFGFIPVERIDFDNSDEDNYFVEVKNLLPMDNIFRVISRTTPKDYEEYFDVNTLRELFVSFLDGEMDSENLRKVVYTIFASEKSCVEELKNFSCFDAYAKLLAENPKLLKDKSLDVFTRKIPHSSEEITVIPGELKDEDDKIADEEFSSELNEIEKLSNSGAISVEEHNEPVNQKSDWLSVVKNDSDDDDLDHTQDLLDDLNEKVSIQAPEEVISAYSDEDLVKPMGATSLPSLDGTDEDLVKPMGAASLPSLDGTDEDLVKPMGAASLPSLDGTDEDLVKPMGAASLPSLDGTDEDLVKPMGAASLPSLDGTDEDLVKPMGAASLPSLDGTDEDLVKPMGAASLPSLDGTDEDLVKPMGAASLPVFNEDEDLVKPMGVSTQSNDISSDDDDLFASATELNELFGEDGQVDDVELTDTIHVKDKTKNLFAGDYEAEEALSQDESLGYIDENQQKTSSFPHQKTMVVAALAGLLITGALMFGKKEHASSDMLAVQENLQDASQAESDGAPDVVSENIDYDANGMSSGDGKELKILGASAEGDDLPSLPDSRTTHTGPQKISSNIDEALSSAYIQTADNAKVTRVSWEVPSVLASESSFQSYFNTTGQAIKDNLSQDLMTISNVITHNMVKLSLIIDEKGEVVESDVTFSTGSQVVDNLVLNTVSNTIKNSKIPAFLNNKKFVKTDLVIFL